VYAGLQERLLVCLLSDDAVSAITNVIADSITVLPEGSLATVRLIAVTVTDARNNCGLLDAEMIQIVNDRQKYDTGKLISCHIGQPNDRPHAAWEQHDTSGGP